MRDLTPDVVIIGGGPAGSSLGCYLARAGVRCVILESARHPRPHVGESLVTSTTRIFQDLDFLPVMEREGFVRKYGASWHAPREKGEFAIEFGEFPQTGIDQDYTYHVDRARFDHLLLQHAAASGAQVFEEVPVREVLFEGSFARGVRVEQDGETVDIPARCVVDASGRQTLLGRQLGLQQADPLFHQFAVHAWMEGVDRGQAASAEHIHIYFLPIKRGWVWQIPINESITSVGVVAEQEVFRQSRQNREEWFLSHLRSTPEVTRAMANARRVNDLKTEADYSYCMQRFCGDGWLLVGDAARFVDPIFSSGVSVALSSAKFASERIQDGLSRGDLGEATLRPYEEKLRAGVQIWYEFIRLYYKLLPVFTYFIESPEHRLQVLQLLQGEVYDRQEVKVLDAMREFIRRIELAPDDNVLKQSLGDVPID